MHDATPLIATIVGGLVLAFIFGAIAHRLRLPVLAGYLLAGVVAGPFTPGYVADAHLAQELAELGVILLMFGVGLHFSLKDLLEVKAVAIPGALVQMAATTVMGLVLGWALDWPLAQGFVFGLALSVASTVVLLRALEERHLFETSRGRIAVGWLIVEDLAMVLALVLLPALASVGSPEQAESSRSLWVTVAITLGKLGLFVALMLVVGKRFIPWLLKFVAHSGSRELFRLAVLAIALGIAFGAAHLFGVSFELGAFLAGMMMGESKLAQQAAEDTLPLRDAFAVLFFVSIGMLFNWHVLVQQPLTVLATFLIITLGKGLVAYVIVRAFGRPKRTAMTIGISLAQIGEFSFILASLGVSLGFLSGPARDILLAAAIVSILVNPLLFKWLHRPREEPASEPVTDIPFVVTGLAGHVVVVGYGRVGRATVQDLRAAGRQVLGVDLIEERVAELRGQGVEAVLGQASADDVLDVLNLPGAAALIVTIPDPFESGEVVRVARTKHPGLFIVARAHDAEPAVHLVAQGASEVVMAETETGRAMVALLPTAG